MKAAPWSVPPTWTSAPTVLFFKGGDMPVDKSVGLVAKETLTEKLDALL